MLNTWLSDTCYTVLQFTTFYKLGKQGNVMPKKSKNIWERWGGVGVCLTRYSVPPARITM